MEICAQETSADACEGVAKPLKEELEDFKMYRRYMYELCDMGYWCILKRYSREIIGGQVWSPNSGMKKIPWWSWGM